MIKFPPCFTCKLYDEENGCCKAFPEGVTDEVLEKKTAEGKKKECSNGIYYEPLE